MGEGASRNECFGGEMCEGRGGSAHITKLLHDISTQNELCKNEKICGDLCT